MTPDKSHAQHDFEHPISDGPNARPRDEPIGQSERGLPDDMSRAVDVTPQEEADIKAKILGSGRDPKAS